MREKLANVMTFGAASMVVFGSFHHWQRDFAHAGADLMIAVVALIAADYLRPTPPTEDSPNA